MLEQARLLNDTVPTSRSAERRPLLVRRFDRFGPLARAMMEDLSAGVGWVSPSGDAPPVGTPIAIRYLFEDYGVMVDFSALVERHFSAPEGAVRQRSLVRHDRVPKEELGRILAIISALGESDPIDQELGACWVSGGRFERWTTETPPEWKKRTSERQKLPDQVTEIIPSRVDGSIPEPLVEEPPASPATMPALERKQRSRAFGLTMKVLLLTASVTAGSVVAVTWLALDNVSVDRAYYFEELSLRTSQYLAQTLRARTLGWQAELTAVLAGTIASGDLETVVHCSERSCEALRGALPAQTLRHRKQPGFALEKEGDLLIVSLSDGKATAVGVVPEARIIDAALLPSYLTAWALGADGTVIAEVGPKKGSHAVVAHVDPKNAGSTQFRDESGEEMIGAWSSADRVRVVVEVPKSVAARALGRLRDQIAYVMAGVLVIAGLIALLFARGLTRRLRLLTAQTAKIGRGEFSEVMGEEIGDEVGQLARSFHEMSVALRERDEEVRDIQRRMSRAEARAVQRQLAESLESQLAPTLETMRSLLESELEESAPQEDFRVRQARLRTLHERASSAVNRALALTSIVNRRVDFASAVSEAIAYLKKKLGPKAQEVKLFAPNAVLFPRLDVKESELREITVTLLERWKPEKPRSGAIEVRLSQRGSELLLAIRYPPAAGGRMVVASALSEVEQLVIDASASAAIHDEGDRTSVVLAFAVDLEAEETAS